MITVGIHENLRILKAIKNEEGTLNIVIGEGSGAAASNGAADIFAGLNDGSQTTESDNLTYFHWPYKLDEYNKTAEDVLEAIKRSKTFLNQMLNCYMTEDKIAYDIFAGINVDKSNPQAAMSLLTNPQVIAKIYDNQISQFINMIAPHIGDSSAKFRMKFVRQSAQKHYATLPRFGKFMEPMTVPASQSVLSYSKWEIENKYNSGEPVDAPAADAAPAPQQTAEVNALFGSN